MISIKRWISVFVLIALVLAGGFRVSALASSAARASEKNYYSIQIQSGDTLWNIAENCCGSTNILEIQDCMSELMRMNHLSDADSLRAGSYLMIYRIAD